MSKPAEGRSGVLAAVRTPLILFALIFLAAEAILLSAVPLAPDETRAVIVWGVLIIFAATLFLFGAIALFRPDLLRPEISSAAASAPPRREEVFDIFLSTPMASQKTDAAYKRGRAHVLKLCNALRSWAGAGQIFYAGKEITETDQFDPEQMAIEDDFKALEQSGKFLLYYPQTLASGALVECGYALALGLPIAIITRNQRELPFMLRNAGQVFGNVNIYESRNENEDIRVIQRAKTRLFPRSKK